ncbi:hypothetical protein D3C86_65110 [compost metagenome]
MIPIVNILQDQINRIEDNRTIKYGDEGSAQIQSGIAQCIYHKKIKTISYPEVAVQQPLSFKEPIHIIGLY